MPILFRDQYTGKPNKFDIPLAHKPLGTQPGDFMLMRVITLSPNEQAPKVKGWTLLTYDYYKDISMFLYTRICDENGTDYSIVRNKVGTNYINIYSWYSTDNKEILIDYKSLVIPNSFKQRNNYKFDINNYKLEYDLLEDKCNIQVYNGRTFINFNIYENQSYYIPTVPRPILNEVSLISNNTAILKWSGNDSYHIEISIDGSSWTRITDESVSENEYIVDNLLPNTSYSFRIKIDNDNVLSEPSKPVSINTGHIILLRSTSKNSASTMNPHIIVSPPNVQKGDLMIMQISYMDNMDIVKLSNGWKLLKELKTNGLSSSIYYKIATRKEPASYFVQHNGLKHKKMLMAIAAFYSINDKPVRIHDANIQYNLPSNYIEYPEASSDGIYSLGIALSVRNLETSLKLPIDYTIIWDTDKNLRTTGIFKSYNNSNIVAPQPIYSTLGASISATISLIEGEIINEIPPEAPTGLRAKKVEGTVIRLNKGMI